jgi:predicted nucleotidyltransferase
MVKNLEEIKAELSIHKNDLKQEYQVKNISVFGSYARGEQKKSSDIDILVEFIKPVGLLKFLKLENELSRVLGVKVDLVTKKALRPRIGKRILKEAARI